jgi:peptidyl-tRNA hydrolase
LTGRIQPAIIAVYHFSHAGKDIPLKQVIAVNRKLQLPKGKLAAQVAHAAVGAFLAASKSAQQGWLQEGMPKIVLCVEDEAALLHLCHLAEQAGVPTCLVEDAGRTVLPAGTRTCLGIGPAPDEAVDQLTGDLPLL